MCSTLCIIFLSLFLQLHHARSTGKPLAPALYVFGDSMSDAGNNNYLDTLAKANFPPYGVDFPGGNTGRFNNGKTVVDFIAEMLGLPFPPPYMGLSAEMKAKQITGVNYASASAGILPDTSSKVGRCLPLEKQITLFGRTVKEDLPKSFESPEALSGHLSKSIFTVWFGGNDYANNYLSDFYNGSKLYSPQKFGELLRDGMSENLKILYKLGARKIVVFDIAVLGCLPAMTNRVDFSSVCMEEMNQLGNEYNRLLPPLLNLLKSQLPGSTFIHGRAFDSFYNIYQNPSKYGFKYTNIPCCVVDNHGTTPCIPNKPPCKDRDQYIFFDAIHTSEASNAIAAVQFFNQSTMCSPMNIQQLSQFKEDNPQCNLNPMD